MSNPTGNTPSPDLAAAPGGVSDEMINRALWAGHNKAAEDHSLAWHVHRDTLAAALAAVITPALRPPQPGVVTEELRKLAEQATPGKWRGDIFSDGIAGNPESDGWDRVAATPNPRSPYGSAHHRQWQANAAFIASAVNFVRSLLSAPSPGASVTASPAPETAPDAGLVEALKPFASLADGYDPDEGDDHQRIWDAGSLTIGDLRRARAALSRAGERT